MSGLSIAPALHIPAQSQHGTPLRLTHASAEQENQQPSPAADASRTAQAAPVQPGIWQGNYAHIQAQLLSTDMNRSFRRPVANSPREAARAYARSRRRPQAVNDQPRLRNVV